jgi:hypothetical protein
MHYLIEGRNTDLHQAKNVKGFTVDFSRSTYNNVDLSTVLVSILVISVYYNNWWLIFQFYY